MRDYGKVQTSFWTSTTMRSLSEDGRTLALYLITSPHSTITGVFRLPDGYVCEDMQWSSERVAKGFEELLAKGFANRCGTTKWVWVFAHLEWNPPENPNQRKSAAKIAVSIPDECVWKPAFMRVCGPLLDLPPWSPPNPSATLSKGLLNQEQEQEQEQERELFVVSDGAPAAPPKRTATRPSLPNRFPEFWDAWPSSPRKVAKAECEKRWKARSLDADADAILTQVDALKATDQWQRGFEPAPLTFLNQRRWEDADGSSDLLATSHGNVV